MRSSARVDSARIAALACLALAAGCASSDATVTERVSSFDSAIAHQDGVDACTMLVPSTAEALAFGAGQPCPEALLDLDLPKLASVIEVQQSGRNAIARTSGGQVFLSRVGDEWKILAAGCLGGTDSTPAMCTLEAG
jgi:hypothetical protein